MRSAVRRRPLVAYFGAAYAISAGALGLVYGPDALGTAPSQAANTARALVAFPLMVAGVGVTGAGLTAIVEGRAGLRRLGSRIGRWRAPARWYAVALVPPCAILVALLLLRALVSPVFTPNLFPFGLLFGALAGGLEEIGWTGYAFPRMESRLGVLRAALLLGTLWGLWHLPVVDHLGAASPHGVLWLPFFVAFVAVLIPLRTLIAVAYARTRSLPLAQLIHASSTGLLVVLGPPRVSPAQETLWYAFYAVLLWVAAWILVRAVSRGDAGGGRPDRRPQLSALTTSGS